MREQSSDICPSGSILSCEKESFFSYVSISPLNIEKTEGMHVGTQKSINHNIFNIRFVNQPVKFLGIHVGQNDTVFNEKNWKEIIIKIVSASCWLRA